MKKRLIIIFLIILNVNTPAQFEESAFKAFGYFQVSFMQQFFRDQLDKKTFSVQQLNLFLQRDLSENWSAFVDFELLNNYSSGKSWGDISLNEVWVKYYLSKRFNLKIGLQVPPFNHLNEISNKTPLLPYIIRPLAYETSFNEFLNLEDFIPRRAFFQMYGFLPIEDTKFDYAFYLGNSPNISTKATRAGQSGIDTTNIFLVGGRVGLRYEDVKVGFSATYDEIVDLKNIDAHFQVISGLKNIPRVRIGTDILMDFKKVNFSAEYIKVLYNAKNLIDMDKQFFYVTLGYRITDELYSYFCLHSTQENYDIELADYAGYSTKVSITIPNFGLVYDINDRIKLKGQFARVDVDVKNSPTDSFLSYYYSAAISVFF